MSNHDENKEKQVLHLMINNICTNNCTLCCNKQYDVNKISVVTVKDLCSVDTVCLTGGAPLINIISCIRLINNMLAEYHNIHNVYIYCNGAEVNINIALGSLRYQMLVNLPLMHPSVNFGLTMSPKCHKDWVALEKYFKPILSVFKSNIIYCFNDDDIKNVENIFNGCNVKIIKRQWQKEFKPAPNTIFRRLPIWTIN